MNKIDLTDPGVSKALGNIEIQKHAKDLIDTISKVEAAIRKAEAEPLAEVGLEERTFRIQLPKEVWESFDIIVRATEATTATMPIETSSDVFAKYSKETDLTSSDIVATRTILFYVVDSIANLVEADKIDKFLLEMIKKLEKGEPPKDG